jgi:alpha-ketoglutarate-dependent taurine dioxygenase
MLALPTVDLGGLSAAETAERVNQLLSDQAQAAFNLHEGPLLRLLLIREAEESHVVSLTMHHIISDAWSLANYTRELTTIYAAYNSGLESPLPELSIQYGDYSLWQEQHLRSESLSRQRAYWNDRLRGLAKLQLPTDHPRPQRPSSRGATQSFELNEELSTSLKDLSRREGVTLFMTLLAAFQTQLSRYSGQQDVAVGTDVANRELLETEPLIGFFINTLVLRTDLSGDPTFRQLLARVRRGTLDGLANQDVPFHDLVKAVQPERNLGLNPLFQVMFIMQNAPASIFSLPGLSVTPIKVDDESSAFDLSVSVEDERDRVGGTFRYSTDLFESKTITRMIEHFTNLLSDIARNPEARLSALEMLEEQTRVVKDKFEGLVAVRPKAISVTRNGLIKSGYLTPDATLPLVVQPALDDVDLVSWATQNRDFVEENLLKHGAILFRNFEVDSLEQFESFTKQTSDRLIAYGERSSPRTALTGHVYTSTDHPADQTILLHNEQSYTLEWPSKIWFYCQQPATRAGRTPIADSRKIAHRLVNVQEKFAQRGVMYVRNYSERFGLPWQEVFQTTSKERVEEYCRSVAIEVEWKVSGELRTRQVREALRAHPRTGEQVWFNHALFFHVSSLEESIRRSMTEGISEADLPYNTYYGDGSAIEPEVLEQIRAAYRLEMVSFDWQRGDILMVDNMLVAHGRESFTGERKIAVVMGDPITAALPEKSEIARI